MCRIGAVTYLFCAILARVRDGMERYKTGLCRRSQSRRVARDIGAIEDRDHPSLRAVMAYADEDVRGEGVAADGEQIGDL